MCRLMTTQLEEALKGYPLYSQDGKGKDAICRAIFALGGVRWFILEGEKEGNGHHPLRYRHRTDGGRVRLHFLERAVGHRIGFDQTRLRQAASKAAGELPAGTAEEVA